MKTNFFIDEKINILTGDTAVDALKKENDKKFLDDKKGVYKVSLERWQKAQACEKNHWFVRGIKSENDRNDYHQKQFDDYKLIKNLSFRNALEIGCGPFTNLRIISKKTNIESITLLDPMIFEYLNHPYVRYNEKRLYSEYLPILGKIVRKYAPSLFKIYLKILSHKIKVRKLLNIPGEKISIAESYDLVVMINVIEHCFDVEELFDKILKITNKGSYFIFEDKLIKNNDIKDAVDNTYDAAHPLKVEENVVLSFLENNFYLIYKRIQTSSNFYADESHFSDDIYFIGKKK